MSTSQQRLGGAMRLAVLFRDAANLTLQLSELKRLRDQVNQAQRSGQEIVVGKPSKENSPTCGGSRRHAKKQSRI